MRQAVAIAGVFALYLASAQVSFAQPELYSGINEGESVLKTLEDERVTAGTDWSGATFPGYLLSGAAGIDLGGLRFEGEVLYNRLLVDDISVSEANASAASVSTLAGMANAIVELPAKNGVTPFFGGGLGYGMPTSGNMTLRSIDLSNGQDGTMIYQVRAGFDYALMPQSKMSLGYRYMLAEDMETGSASRDRIDANQTKSHVIELGFHFAF